VSQLSGTRRSHPALVQPQPNPHPSPLNALPPSKTKQQYGNGTLRLTTRQAYQLHGVLKTDLKTVFSTVIKNMGTSMHAIHAIHCLRFTACDWIIACDTAVGYGQTPFAPHAGCAAHDARRGHAQRRGGIQRAATRTSAV